MESLTSRDITCINFHNIKEECIICSSYQDITFTEVINDIDRSMVYANNNGKEILIGSDTNSHSHLCCQIQNELGADGSVSIWP